MAASGSFNGIPRMPTSLTVRYHNEVVSQVDFSNRGV